MRLLPREEKFYALFLNQAALIGEASQLLLDTLKSGPAHYSRCAEKLNALEHKGDEIIHEIFTRLNQTFITPLDPEDIHNLSSRLDDVLDGLEEAGHRLVAYKLGEPPARMTELAAIIAVCCATLKKAFEALESDGAIQEHCIEINRLENEADNIVRQAVADLLNGNEPPILIVKLKEIYEFLEDTADRCEDVADALQNVVVKNS